MFVLAEINIHCRGHLYSQGGKKRRRRCALDARSWKGKTSGEVSSRRGALDNPETCLTFKIYETRLTRLDS